MQVGLETLKERASVGRERLKACNLCPRECGVDRVAGELGYCGLDGRLGNGDIDPDTVFVSSAMPHFGEEDCLVGRNGSGTVFFSGCNLTCLFCQNAEISQGGEGRWISLDRLASLFLDLDRRGCHNLNIVTPTHFVAQLLQALVFAAERGFDRPLVYNCGGYESVETIKLLDGIVDIYMPDFKYGDSATAQELSDAPDYAEHAKSAMREMHRQVGDLRIDGPSGTTTRGLLVRHLVLPNDLAGTQEVMRFLAEEISTETYVNIMDQYRPCLRAHTHTSVNRRISSDEYLSAVETAKQYGLHRGFPKEPRPRLLFW